MKIQDAHEIIGWTVARAANVANIDWSRMDGFCGQDLPWNSPATHDHAESVPCPWRGKYVALNGELVMYADDTLQGLVDDFQSCNQGVTA